MSSTVGIRWSIPLDALATGVGDYAERMDGAIAEMMEEEADKAQDEMREGRRWTDRTDHARDSLMATYERRGNEHVIVLYTNNREYGWALELARAGRYAIIRPTMNLYEPIVFERAQNILGG